MHCIKIILQKKMVHTTLNWSSVVFLIIGFALILAALTYSEAKKTMDTTFRVLSGIGLGLIFLGLVLVIIGHWSIFFPMKTQYLVTQTDLDIFKQD